MDHQGDSIMAGLENLPPRYDHSTAHISSQPKTSFTKLPKPNNLQTVTQGLDKKAATIELTVRQKPSAEHSPAFELPAYAQAAKFTEGLVFRTRQSARSTKFFDVASKSSEGRRAKTNKQPVEEEFHPCQITEIPADMFTIENSPNGEFPFYFTGTGMGYTTLGQYCANGGMPAFLCQPIATGDWQGALVSISTRKGHTCKAYDLPGKVTWRELLESLHEHHPTGTLYDPDDDDNDRPEGYWEYFKVGISLLYSQLG